MLEMRNPVASLLLILTTAKDIEMAPEAHVHKILEPLGSHLWSRKHKPIEYHGNIHSHQLYSNNLNVSKCLKSFSTIKSKRIKCKGGMDMRKFK